MSEDDDIEYVECIFCGTVIADDDETIYIEGKPYCEDCQREGEIYADVGED